MDTVQYVVLGIFTFGSACWLLVEFWHNVRERFAAVDAADEMPVPQWMRKADIEPKETPSHAIPAQGESATRPYSNEPVPIFHRRELVGSGRRLRRSA